MSTSTKLLFETLKKTALIYMKEVEFKVVERAYNAADAAHMGQLRLSGEPYIHHPLQVALTLAALHLDPATLAAAFLHDVAEDTAKTIIDIKKQFGGRITNLVDGVTKLDRIEEKRGLFRRLLNQGPRQLSQQERRTESLRKMLLATSRDIRVVLIKLADRLHNMETLKAMEPEKQRSIAEETLEIYAPLAYRLGIGTIKGQLEDLAFANLKPKEYERLKRIVKHEAADRERQIRRAKQIIHRMLARAGIKAELNARAKHLYSLHRKLQRYDNDISKIYDLVACRIIVSTVEECYQVLGLIHERWQPFDDRVKDYIAAPKPNGYQSLHTTVKALGDKPIEFQIRTKAMHEQAEFGVAAHWHYSEKKGTLDYLRRQVSMVPKNELTWVTELAKWQRHKHSTNDFDKLMKIDFFGDRLFAYTPKGDVIDLPVESTPIDFAYAIHSEIGNHLAGAKVNGKMVKLNDPLHSGDTVELMVQKKSCPHNDWLQSVKTAHAKERIRQALRRKNKPVDATNK